MRNVHLFSCDHDVIKIGPGFLEQKANILSVIQPTLRSTLSVYDIVPPYLDMCSKLLATFALSPVLSFQVRPRTIKVFLMRFKS